MPGSWPSGDFPNLTGTNHVVTSPVTRTYNCIAWAAGSNNRWWWPDTQGQYYWPPSVARTETIEAFIEAYGTLGYVECSKGELEDGFEKIAIYAVAGTRPSHAARQLPNGQWTSKLGGCEDIAHVDVSGLDGPVYGSSVKFMKRPTLGTAGSGSP